jgi:hypothetical protein
MIEANKKRVQGSGKCMLSGSFLKKRESGGGADFNADWYGFFLFSVENS